LINQVIGVNVILARTFYVPYEANLANPKAHCDANWSHHRQPKGNYIRLLWIYRKQYRQLGSSWWSIAFSLLLTHLTWHLLSQHVHMTYPCARNVVCLYTTGWHLTVQISN